MIEFSREELEQKKRLIAAAGLIKVYDGHSWVDLRDVMTHILDYAIHLADRLEAEIKLTEGRAEPE